MFKSKENVFSHRDWALYLASVDRHYRSEQFRIAAIRNIPTHIVEECLNIRIPEVISYRDPCWCKSGLEYRFCHYRRAEKRIVNQKEFNQAFTETGRRGEVACTLRPAGGCKGPIIRSHSIQRSGGLSSIAEADRVLSLMQPPQYEATELRYIFVKVASVFRALCEHHDAAIFKEIEGVNVELDARSALLFYFRALLFTISETKRRFEMLPWLRRADSGRNVEDQLIWQRYLFLMNKQDELEHMSMLICREQIEAALRGEAKGRFHVYALRFDRTIPVAVSTFFRPYKDLDGSVIAPLGAADIHQEDMTVTVTTYSGSSVAVFAWFGDDNGPCSRLIRSLVAVPDEEKADALVRLIFSENIYNVFISPRWWQQLPAEKQKELMKKRRQSAQLPTSNEQFDRKQSPVAEARIIERVDVAGVTSPIQLLGWRPPGGTKGA